MARIRTVKQAFFLDWDLYRAEVDAGLPLRLAFESLWPVADREGRFHWKPEELKPQCLPFDPVDFAAVLVALEAGGFVRRYEVDGRCYGCIPSFLQHQKPNQHESASVIPGPDEATESIPCTHVHAHGEGNDLGNGIGKGNGGSAEPPCDSTPTNSLRIRADDGECILTFPVVGTHGSEWRLRRRQVDEWGGLYPGLDVIAECRHALAWVQANPGRRKTPQGMPRFLTNWFNRTVERRPAAAVSSKTRNEPQTDWFEECQRLHGGLCNGQYAHGLQLRIDAQRGLPTGAI